MKQQIIFQIIIIIISICLVQMGDSQSLMEYVAGYFASLTLFGFPVWVATDPESLPDHK